MTTIAWDGDTLACDSMAIKRDNYVGDTAKIKTLEGKIIVSLAGSLKIFEIIMPYIRNIYLGDDKKEYFLEASNYFKGNDDNWFELAVFYLKSDEKK